MAQQHSFDIASKIDSQEVVNAVDQAMREIGNRYDLKDSDSSLDYNQGDNLLTAESSDDYKLKAVLEIFRQKLVKRGISLNALIEEKAEDVSMGRARQIIRFQQGISQENSKVISKDIKGSKFKVQVQIQGDQVRVVSPKIDTLREVIAFLKEKKYPFDYSFINLR